MELEGKASAPPPQLEIQPPAQPAPQTPSVQPAPQTPPAPPAPVDLTSRYSKPPEAPPAPIPQDIPPEEPPGDPRTDPKAAHAYAQLRSENAKYKREVVPTLEQAKKDAEEARAAAEAKVTLLAEEKRKSEEEKTSLLERLGRVSLMESPQFKQKYGAREMEITGKLTGALTKFAGLTPDQAADFASRVGSLETPEAIAQATADMHPSVAGAVLLAAQELAVLDEDRSAELSNWRQSQAASEVTGAREAAVRSAEDRVRLADDALDFAKKLGSPVYASQNPEDQAELQQLQASFRGFAQRASDQELMRAAAEGYSAPILYKAIEERDSIISDLVAQVQGFKHAMGMPVRPPSQAAPAAPIPVPQAAPAAAGDSPDAIARRFAQDAVGGFMLRQ